MSYGARVRQTALLGPDYNSASCELNANAPTIHMKEGVSKQKHTNSEVLYRSSVKNAATRLASAAKSLQLRPTLCDPIDGSPPGSPVPGILQARTPEWVAISFSNA